MPQARPHLLAPCLHWRCAECRTTPFIYLHFAGSWTVIASGYSRMLKMFRYILRAVVQSEQHTLNACYYPTSLFCTQWSKLWNNASHLCSRIECRTETCYFMIGFFRFSSVPWRNCIWRSQQPLALPFLLLLLCYITFAADKKIVKQSSSLLYCSSKRRRVSVLEKFLKLVNLYAGLV
jgi:hypothetical protein